MATSKYHLKRKGDTYYDYMHRVHERSYSDGLVVKLKPSDFRHATPATTDPRQAADDSVNVPWSIEDIISGNVQASAVDSKRVCECDFHYPNRKKGKLHGTRLAECLQVFYCFITEQCNAGFDV